MWSVRELFVPVPLPEMETLLESVAALGLNAELQGLYDPRTLEEPYGANLARIQRSLKSFPGRVSVHAPFLDLNPISPDPRIAAASRHRTEQSFEIAETAGAEVLLFHSQCSAFIRDPGYMESWERDSVAFWRGWIPRATGLGCTVVFENIFEPDAGPQRRLVDGLGSPAFRAALDTGHAHLFSGDVPPWVEALGPRLGYVHVHDNDGRWDLHRPPGEGTAALRETVAAVAALPAPPPLSLEIYSEEGIRRALDWLAREGFLR